MIILLFSPIFVLSVIKECQRVTLPEDVPCTISSTWRPTDCGATIRIFKNNTIIKNMTWTNGTPFCTFVFNLTALGMYQYNSTIETGVITLEGSNMMDFTVILFLLIFNIAVFLVPYFVKQFTSNIGTDYIIRHLFWMGGLIFLWFNTTILRQMASTAGLGIDAQLAGYWWFFTILVVIVIFAMVYVTAVGAIKLSQEVKFHERMGDNENG